ncbi:hypothetical protein BLNAU_16739 [Blattamonas nauphoetae]|uniref:Uncharacterized protein n=1 Tax=Blattamonas nauphoetae TaxID=2049346 RepID=A0ABQ9XAD7_9EUKA|nr:hypothetical protein BLNAU_16739 [Blattamonas nauphoetae]
MSVDRPKICRQGPNPIPVWGDEMNGSYQLAFRIALWLSCLGACPAGREMFDPVWLMPSVGEDDDSVFEALYSSPSLKDSEGSEKEQNLSRFLSPSDIHTPPSISELGGEEEGTGREEAEAEEAREHRSSVQSFPHPSSLGFHQTGPELG